MKLAAKLKTRHWCVKHRAGWCAVAGNARPEESATSVATVCGYFVTLPLGSAQRSPTCAECLAKLQEPNHER